MRVDTIDHIMEELRSLDFLSSHDYYHLLRVHSNVVMLCSEGLVEEQVARTAELAALLHDVGRKRISYGSKDEHEQESAEIARELLSKYEVPEGEIDDVIQCIVNHRASKAVTSDSQAVQILQDADRLDALGAIAIARTFSYDSNRPLYLPEEPAKAEYDGVSLSSINHIIEKILKLAPETFNSPVARRVAEKRLAYVRGFVDEFLQEWNGER